MADSDEPRNFVGDAMHYKKAPESVTACGLQVGVDIRSIATSFRTEWVTCERCKSLAGIGRRIDG